MWQGNTEVLDFALGVEQITTKKRDTLILNVDGCIAVCFVDMLRSCGAFTREEADELIDNGCLNGLFVLGRSIGFIGHYLDQKRLKQPLYRHPWDDITVKMRSFFVVFVRLACLPSALGLVGGRGVMFGPPSDLPDDIAIAHHVSHHPSLPSPFLHTHSPRTNNSTCRSSKSAPAWRGGVAWRLGPGRQRRLMVLASRPPHTARAARRAPPRTSHLALHAARQRQ